MIPSDLVWETAHKLTRAEFSAWYAGMVAPSPRKARGAPTQDKILAAMKVGRVTPKSLAQAVYGHDSKSAVTTIRVILFRMARQGRIRHLAPGLYALNLPSSA